MTGQGDARKALADEALRLYRTEGMTLMQVAAKLEVSYGKAHSLVKEAGGMMRRRGGPQRTTKKEDP